MTDTELLPCPFCGGKPSVRRASGDERDGYAAHVSYVCSGCGCAKGACGDSGKGGYADNSTVEARAVESWNTRAGFTAVDMGTAAADGRRSLAEHLIKQIAIAHPDQDTLLTVSHIAQWIALEAGLLAFSNARCAAAARTRRCPAKASSSSPNASTGHMRQSAKA